MKKLPVATLAMFALVMPAGAQTLSGDELRARIVDKTVHLSTPYGLELPLRYGSNGDVSGDLGGFSMASMFAPRETGSWWIDGENLCQQWPTWYDGEVFCFVIENTGDDTISWTRNDGMSGTARIEG